MEGIDVNWCLVCDSHYSTVSTNSLLINSHLLPLSFSSSLRVLRLPFLRQTLHPTAPTTAFLSTASTTGMQPYLLLGRPYRLLRNLYQSAVRPLTTAISTHEPRPRPSAQSLSQSLISPPLTGPLRRIHTLRLARTSPLIISGPLTGSAEAWKAFLHGQPPFHLAHLLRHLLN